MRVPCLSSVFCVMFLVACGGGGGGGSDVTPTEVVTNDPPPASIETPPEQLDSTPFAGTWQGTFSGTDGGTWQATVAPNGTVTGSAVSRTGVSFDATGTVSPTGELTLTTVGRASTGATFRGTIADGQVSGNWTNFGGAGGTFTGAQTSTLQASLVEPRRTSDVNSFDYLAFGDWLEQHALNLLDGDAGATVDAARAIVGAPTSLDSMPSSGSASYVGTMAAVETAAGAEPTTLHGPLVATADFDRGAIAGNAELARIDDGSAWGHVRFDDASVLDNGFQGRAVSSRTHDGFIAGRFGGMDASDLGGIVSLDGPTTVHGVFAGKQP